MSGFGLKKGQKLQDGTIDVGIGLENHPSFFAFVIDAGFQPNGIVASALIFCFYSNRRRVHLAPDDLSPLVNIWH